ncbi:MAG TPA: hypothetical protein PKH69_03220 [Thiobacillaceae bacterium]|nr:hypothetical protein [Thiobacillaceae bacterium]
MKQDPSKRSFFRQATMVLGVLAAAGYTRSMLSASSGSRQNLRYKYVNDEKLQELTWTRGRLTEMTDTDKQDMLATLLGTHPKHQA